MNTRVVIDVMKVLRKEFQHEDENGKFDPMLEVDILTLAQAAQTILETTSNFVADSAAEKLRVRVSNLEAINDNLRTNNAALREVPTKIRALLAPLRATVISARASDTVDAIEEAISVATPEPSIGGVPLRVAREVEEPGA